MTLYHGSYMEVVKPDLLHSRENVDFGKGFYTTPYREQALLWCNRFKRRGQDAYLSYYEWDEKACEIYKIKYFENYSEEWLDFVFACRSCKDISDYDIIIGGVANDKVFNTVELYGEHLIDKKEALTRLQYEKPNLQICFRRQHIIDGSVCFERSEKI